MNDIEQQFFKTFGIEKQLIYLVMDMGKSHICDKKTVVLNKELFKQKSRRCYVKAVKKFYPEITAEKLVELICIKSKDSNGYRISANSYETIKEDILKDLMKAYSTYVLCTWEEERAEKIIHQVRALFKEAE